jgi:hypothetical protein
MGRSVAGNKTAAPVAFGYMERPIVCPGDEA